MKVKLSTPLYPFQRELIESVCLPNLNNNTTVAVKAPRQIGKSTTISLLILKLALEHKRYKIIYILPSWNQSYARFKEINRMTKSFPSLVTSSNASLCQLEFWNGSIILFLSAEQDSDALRGYTADVVVYDEAALISSRVYDDTAAYADARKALVMYISTPRFRSGRFYDIYQRGLNGEKGIISVDWKENRLISDDRLEFYRSTLSPIIFSQDYLCEFTDAKGQVFDVSTVIGDVVDRDITHFGLDLATTGADETVLCGVNKNGDCVRLWSWTDLDPQAQADRIAEVVVAHPTAKMLTIERNGVGTALFPIIKQTVLKKGFKGVVKDWLTTQDSKAVMVSELQVDIANGVVTIANDPKLILQLTVFEAKQTSNGKVSYAAAGGGHDDAAMAFLIAHHSTKTKGATIAFL